MSPRFPHVLGLTSNNARTNASAHKAERILFTPTVPMTRWAFSWRPAAQDAEETVLDMTGVSVVGVQVHRGSGPNAGVLVADLPGGALTNGRFQSAWQSAPLEQGVDYTVTIEWAAPTTAKLAAGVGYCWTGAGLSATSWAPAKRNTGNPTVLFETPSRPRVTIVLGDSNVAGVLLGRPVYDTAYGVVSRRLGEVVVPLGYSGESMAETVASRMQWDGVLDLTVDPDTGRRLRGDVGIIELGINDCLIRGEGALTSLRTQLPQMVDRMRTEMADDVWACTLPGAHQGGWPASNGGEVARRGYNSWLRSLTPGQVPFLKGVIDYAKVIAGGGPAEAMAPEYTIDMLHYNEQGHAALAEALIPYVGKPRQAHSAGGGALFKQIPSGSLYMLRDVVSGRVLGARGRVNSGIGTPKPKPVDYPVALRYGLAGWTEQPTREGLAADMVSTPLAPAPGEAEPRVTFDGGVAYVNATGLFPASVEWSATTDTGVKSFGSGAEARLSGLTTTPTITATVNGTQVWSKAFDVRPMRYNDRRNGYGTHPLRAGKTVRLEAKFKPVASGVHWWQWVPLTDMAASYTLDGTTGELDAVAGVELTAALSVTAPASIPHRMGLPFRLIVGGPDGTVMAQKTVWVTALGDMSGVPPRAEEWDDRIPVAAPLSADVTGWPTMKAGDDPDRPNLTGEQVLAALLRDTTPSGQQWQFRWNIGDYGIPVVPVPTDTEWQPARWSNGQYKPAPDPGYAPWSGAGAEPAIHSQLLAPTTIDTWWLPALGSDSTLGLWDAETSTYTELWQAMTDQVPQWMATHGGRVDLSKPGADGTFPAWYGVSAAGIAKGPVSLSAFALRTAVTEMIAGREWKKYLTHALVIDLPYIWSGGWAWPAKRTDGRGNRGDEIRMGQRIALLPPSQLDIDAQYAAGRFTPVQTAVAYVAQRYGIIAADTLIGPTPALVGRTYPAQKTYYGADPWSGIPGGLDLSGIKPEMLRILPPAYDAPGGKNPAAGHPAQPIIPPRAPDTPVVEGVQARIAVDGATATMTSTEEA